MSIGFIKKGKMMEIHLDEKVVIVKGHQDDDAYRIFTESFEQSPLTPHEKAWVRNTLDGSKDIIID